MGGNMEDEVIENADAKEKFEMPLIENWKTELSRRRKWDLGKFHLGNLTWPVVAQLALVVAVTLFILLLTSDSDLTRNMQNRFRVLEYSNEKPPDWSQESHSRVDDSSKVEAFLEDIRRLTAVAAAGEDFSPTPEEEADWHAKNPCASRAELPFTYAARRSGKHLPDHRVWDEVLKEYSKLHRTCMKRAGDDFTAYFKGNVDIPGCNFLISEPVHGLGNKLLVLSSGLMYAIATKRIFLMTTFTPDLLCEPFVGSSWIIKGDFPRAEGENEDANQNPGAKYWIWGNDFMDRAEVKERLTLMKEGKICYGKNCARGDTRQPPLARSIVVTSMRGVWPDWQPPPWFYCDMEQQLLAEIPWIYYSGCVYAGSMLFASPAFAPLFHALFPGKMVITTVLRTICLPGDVAWERFKRLNRAYFKDADRRIGLQLRIFGWDANREVKGKVLVDRTLDCVLNNKILPNVSTGIMLDEPELKGRKSSSTSTVVFIASLLTELRDRLNDIFLRNPTETHEDVTLVQLTAQKWQSFSLEDDREALVEVLLLSSADELMVTPGSTFGGIAQGYGGIVPWFLRMDDDDSNKSSCQRSHTADVCHQGGRLEYNCPNDSPTSPRFSPSLTPCPTLEATGVTLQIG